MCAYESELPYDERYHGARKRPSSFLDNELAEELRRNIRDLARELIDSPRLWDDLQSALSDSLAAAVYEKLDDFLWENVVNSLREDEDIYQWARYEALDDLKNRVDVRKAALNKAVAAVYNSGEADEVAINRLMQNPEIQRKAIDQLKSLPELRTQAVNEIKMNLAGIGSPLATSLDEAAILRAVDNMLDGRADDDGLDL